MSRFVFALCWLGLVSVALSGCRKRPYKHITEKLSHPQESVRRKALKKLAALGPKAASAVPEIAALLDDARLYRQAANTLAAIGAPAVSALQSGLTVASWRHREAAADALGRVGAPAKAAVPALIRRLESKHRFEVQAAARAIGQIGPTPDALRALARLLRAESRAVRRQAVIAIGKAGADAAPYVSELTTAAQSKAYKIREAAVRALQRVGPKAVPLLRSLLEADESSVRDVHTKLHVIRALGQMGALARPALSTLTLHLGYQSEHAAQMTVMGLASSASLRAAAARALLRLIPHMQRGRAALRATVRRQLAKETKAPVQKALQQLLQALSPSSPPSRSPTSRPPAPARR